MGLPSRVLKINTIPKSIKIVHYKIASFTEEICVLINIPTIINMYFPWKYFLIRDQTMREARFKM